MRVLVTGSSGFLGAHVVARLAADGHEVIALDRVEPNDPSVNATFVRADLLDHAALAAAFQHARPDALVHLAARTDLDGRDLSAYAANIDGVRNVVDAVRATPTIRRALYTSSQLVCRVGHVPSSDTEYAPDTLYGESKVLTERIVRDEDGGRVDWSLLRPTTIWGPGMSAHYQRFFRLIADGRYVHVGKRALRKSYGYAGNVAYQYSALLRADASAMNRRMFYVGDYEPISLRAWVDAFQRALGAPPVRTVPEPMARTAALVGDALNRVGWNSFPYNSFRLRNVLTEYVFDLARTRAICGPVPFSMAQGVDATVRWLRDSGVVPLTSSQAVAGGDDARMSSTRSR